MRIRIFAASVALLLPALSSASAQWVYDDRAATAGESYARGMSDVIRSQGVYNDLTSQAAINMTQAQKQAIENQQQWVSTYFQMRDENRAQRAKERGPAPTSQDLIRYAEQGAPKRLGPEQVEVVTGEINWPDALRAEQFAQERQTMDQMFAQRAASGMLPVPDMTKARQTADAMLQQLQSQIRDMPSSVYIQARSFLTSLRYEVTLPAA